MKQMEEAEVRVRRLTEKDRELEIKFKQLEREIRKEQGGKRGKYSTYRGRVSY
ncbi:hypothetical protein ALC53_11582 [Atta colombica]|uniref:Uncharacterized protein n=1 Tax=Atta colombica TaxID=520822 RepID=A0A195B116_9HYME|nr:hypothetical protein ALC53_11582 [Atta colombica]